MAARLRKKELRDQGVHETTVPASSSGCQRPWAVVGRTTYDAALATGVLLLHGAASARKVGSVLGSTMSFWSGVTVLAFVAMTGVFLAVWLSRRLHGMKARVARQGSDLQRYQVLLAQADEGVRREVAEMLHGPVQSKLLAAQVRVERARSMLLTDLAAGRDELAAVVALLDDVRETDVRLASHRLHPPALRVGLVTALRSLAASFEGSFGLEVALTITDEVKGLDDPARGRLPDAIRLAVYRALEEALANSYRHGAAAHVRVELSLVHGPRLQLVVNDDGEGFDASQFTMGLGVASLAARVEQLGGAWFIDSTPGDGATLTVAVPVPAAKGPAQSTVMLPSR